MDVRAQSHVVSEVPAIMVGIVIDDDVIAIPQPVVTESNVVGRDTEKESPEPKAIGISTT